MVSLVAACAANARLHLCHPVFAQYGTARAQHGWGLSERKCHSDALTCFSNPSNPVQLAKSASAMPRDTAPGSAHPVCSEAEGVGHPHESVWTAPMREGVVAIPPTHC
eukprot:735559-Prymnesium_polylepis.1